uniref:Uncharacterized protein n=1 Tax=Bursaphelenchus xylophilus TaxID=6326 RepID=A0A1I7S8K8_BURXY
MIPGGDKKDDSVQRKRNNGYDGLEKDVVVVPSAVSEGCGFHLWNSHKYRTDHKEKPGQRSVACAKRSRPVVRNERSCGQPDEMRRCYGSLWKPATF